MTLSIIVAMAHNRVIGLQGQMPWYLPADLAWFKRNTVNKPVIMGRKTFESIGRPLPNRENIVISRNVEQFQNRDQLQNSDRLQNSTTLIWVDSLDKAIAITKHHAEAFIIGGGNIYQQAMPLVDRLYLTHIDAELQGDTYFPEYHPEKWQLTYQEDHQADEKNPYPYRFEILDKI
ncbi:type 3 dihydrofolate reductase [Orbaceae bacterium ESL0721]|nr:type 3 dihydrofolate reductase [Orbaceae bacterium ESL0721]